MVGLLQLSVDSLNSKKIYTIYRESTEKVNYTTKVENKDMEINFNRTDTEILLKFDSIIELEYSKNLEITDYPFDSEHGKTKITEYMFNNPEKITMKAIKSYNSVLSNFAKKLIDIESEIDKIKQQLNILTSGIYKLKILTRNGLRENFTLESFSMSETLDNYNNLEVDLTFKQVITFEEWNKTRQEEDSKTKNGGNLQAKKINKIINTISNYV